MLDADVIIVGGGIAGAGAAYEISRFASVVLLERETRCGYHSTGRSAAPHRLHGSAARRPQLAQLADDR